MKKEGRGKRRKEFTGIRRNEKVPKFNHGDNDIIVENNTDCDEGIVFPPGSTAAVSVAIPTENNLDIGTNAYHW